MYEYEFRLMITLPDLKHVLKFFMNKTTHNYTVKYINHFRCKDELWELKKKLRQIMVYHYKSGNWIRFVESRELSFNQWKQKYYKEFKQHLAFRQNIFDLEHRYEIKLDKNAKLYGFNKKDLEYGLVFELEVYNDQTRCEKLPIDINLLNPYCDILQLFYKKAPPAYTLHKCIRKPVIITNKEIEQSLKAMKHDGIFGHVYSYANYIFEQWEDFQCFLFRNETLGDGFVYGAERIDNKVILLYVAQVRGLGVYNVFDVLLKYLRTIAVDAPLRYNMQYYYEERKDMKYSKISDGIIYHTQEDKIYKLKRKHTLDLLYDNGFFVTKEGLIQCYENNLENGIVYECDLSYNVIRPRYDRVLSNTPKQIKQILTCCKKKLNYSFLFNDHN